jgi:hypothetical protein
MTVYILVFMLSGEPVVSHFANPTMEECKESLAWINRKEPVMAKCVAFKEVK